MGGGPEPLVEAAVPQLLLLLPAIWCVARRRVEVGVEPFELVGVAAAAKLLDDDGKRPLDMTT